MTFLGFPTQKAEVKIVFTDIGAAVSVQREVQNITKARKDLQQMSTKVKLVDGRKAVVIPNDGEMVIVLRNVLDRFNVRKRIIKEIKGCDPHILGY